MDTYQLLDSGHFEKLEQVGPYRLIRPAPQAIWQPSQPTSLWAAADAHYHRSSSGGGDWEYKRKLPTSWTVTYYGLTMKIKLTNFGHLGLFAEQGSNWDWIRAQIKTRLEQSTAPVNVLNTFAYTGGSSLVAAQVGAHVVHLDAAKGIVSWARENATLCNLDDKPIRWLIDDVTKFISREARRNNRYEAIILDPPSFGRGPKKELWKFEQDLGDLMALCRQILSDNPLFILLSAHTPGFTHLALQHVLADMMQGYKGTLGGEEMVIPELESGRLLPSGSIAWWVNNNH